MKYLIAVNKKRSDNAQLYSFPSKHLRAMFLDEIVTKGIITEDNHSWAFCEVEQ